MTSQNRPRNLKWKELAHCFTCLERKSGFCRPLSTHCFSIYRHQGRQDATYEFDLDAICSDFILNQPTLGRKVNTDLGIVRQNSSIVVTLGFVNKKRKFLRYPHLRPFCSHDLATVPLFSVSSFKFLHFGRIMYQLVENWANDSQDKLVSVILTTLVIIHFLIIKHKITKTTWCKTINQIVYVNIDIQLLENRVRFYSVQKWHFPKCIGRLRALMV